MSAVEPAWNCTVALHGKKDALFPVSWSRWPGWSSSGKWLVRWDMQLSQSHFKRYVTFVKSIHESSCFAEDGTLFEYPGGSTVLETRSMCSIEIVSNTRLKRWAQNWTVFQASYRVAVILYVHSISLHCPHFHQNPRLWSVWMFPLEMVERAREPVCDVLHSLLRLFSTKNRSHALRALGKVNVSVQHVS